MVELRDNDKLSVMFKAVSDQTRRTLLLQLCQQGPTRVTDLAKVHAMSLNAISKHIKVLEIAGLVKRKTLGRTHWIEAELAEVAHLEAWFSKLKSIWELRLTKLNEIVATGDKNETTKPKR